MLKLILRHKPREQNRFNNYALSRIVNQCKASLFFLRKCVRIFGGKAHENRYVRGISFNPSGNRLISVGDDKKILTWNLEDLQTVDYGDHVPVDVEPEDSVLSKVNKSDSIRLKFHGFWSSRKLNSPKTVLFNFGKFCI